jgi:uncharacterized protein (TIGR00159 family)
MTDTLLQNGGAYSFGWRDLLDILVMAVLIYQVGLIIKGTRALQTLVGVLLVILAYWATAPDRLSLLTIHRVLGHVLFYAPFAIIVLFLSPLRRALARLGRTSMLRLVSRGMTGPMLEAIVKAAGILAARSAGALIVIERDQVLKDEIEAGVQIDAVISYDLLMNIFSPGAPLHDGAAILGEGRVKAASSFLTVTSSPQLSSDYGSRHRAAIGVTEEYDSVAIVASEERGEIRAAVNGQLTPVLDENSLRSFLLEHLDQGMARRDPRPTGDKVSEQTTRAAPGGVGH